MNTPARFNLMVLRVSDLERAAAFYRVLGLAFLKHAHGTGPQHYASECDGYVFELYPATTTQPIANSVRIGFAVDDVDVMVTKLLDVPGAKVLTAPADSEWGRRAVVADPDGHRVELIAAAAGK